jgi:hypothetical protein
MASTFGLDDANGYASCDLVVLVVMVGLSWWFDV